MAEIKVSQLPEASAINDEDLLMIVQGGTNKKITKENCQFASGDEIAISTTEPVGEEKIWINPEEVPSGIGTDISNVYSDAQDKAYSCHYINNSDSYSTSEIKTNKTWIDGKPIYRKTFDVDNLAVSTSGATIPSGLSNVGVVTKIDVNAKDSSNVWYSFWHFTDVMYQSNGNIKIYTDSSATFTKAYITIEYTKTTD